jgi:hypothetical protein
MQSSVVLRTLRAASAARMNVTVSQRARRVARSSENLPLKDRLYGFATALHDRE